MLDLIETYYVAFVVFGLMKTPVREELIKMADQPWAAKFFAIAMHAPIFGRVLGWW